MPQSEFKCQKFLLSKICNAIQVFSAKRKLSFFGQKRTIVTTLKKDIQRTKRKNTFPVFTLISDVSLQYICMIAKNRKLWVNIVKLVVDVGFSSCLF